VVFFIAPPYIMAIFPPPRPLILLSLSSLLPLYRPAPALLPFFIRTHNSMPFLPSLA
jgi:hypothetical protein